MATLQITQLNVCNRIPTKSRVFVPRLVLGVPFMVKETYESVMISPPRIRRPLEGRVQDGL